MHDSARTNQELVEEISTLKQKIKELKQSESDLKTVNKEVEEKYRNIFDNAPEGIIQTTADGRLLSVNLALAQIFGYSSHEEMITSVIDIGSQFYFSQEERQEHLRLINEKVEVRGFEARIRRKDGSCCWVSINARVVRNSTGEPVHYEGFMRDISERKQTEEALRESENRYKSLFENNHAVMLLIDPDNSAIKDANPAACAYYGWTREELTKMRVDEINTMEGEEVAAEMQSACSENRNHFFFKHRLANGTIRDVEVYSGAILPENKPLLYSIVHDITERRIAEGELKRYQQHLEDMVKERTAELGNKNITLQELNKALRESEERFRLAYSTSPDAININRMSDGLYVEINEGFTRLTGFTREDVIGRTSLEISIWRNPADRQKLVDGLQDKGYCENLEAEFYRKDGSIAAALMSARIIMLQDIPHIISITRDISDQMRTAVALQNTFRRFQVILSSLYGGILVVSDDSRIEFVNQAFCDLFDLDDSPEDLLGLTATQIIEKIANVYADPPDALARIRELLSKRQPIKNEEVSIRGERTYMRDFIPVVVDGKQYGRLWYYHDITDRRQAQIALQDAELKYRMVADNTYDWEFWINTDGEFIYISPSCQRVTGYRAMEFQKDTKLFQRIIHPDDHEIFENHINAEDQSHAPGFVTFRIIHRDGTEKWIEHTCQSVHDGEGKYLGRRGSNRDISERKRIAEALLESEKRLNLALHVAHMGYWDWDVRTNKVKWYGESASLFGVREEDFGETIDHVQNCVHPDDRMRGMEVLRRVLEEKILFENTYRVVHPNGELRWLYSYGQLFYDDKGEPLNIFGVTQDITNRKQAEDEIMRRTIEIEEANTALRVLMNHRDEDRKMLEEKIESNINELVIPYLKKLSQTNNDIVRKEYLKILENNLINITASFTNNLSNLYKNLTPQEIQIADLIRHGKNTKEIAEILNASSHTIGTHRNNIRKKVNLRNTKSNLRTFLMSLS